MLFYLKIFEGIIHLFIMFTSKVIKVFKVINVFKGLT